MSNLITKPNITHEDLNLVNPNLLPPQIRAFIQIIGLPDTIILLESKGGTFIRIPFEAKGSQLESIIGLSAANKLCEVMGGQKKELPKPDKILTQLRNHAIRNARKNMSASQVALKFNLTRRHVINLTPDDIENPTDDLFG